MNYGNSLKAKQLETDNFIRLVEGLDDTVELINQTAIVTATSMLSIGH